MIILSIVLLIRNSQIFEWINIRMVLLSEKISKLEFFEPALLGVDHDDVPHHDDVHANLIFGYSHTNRDG